MESLKLALRQFVAERDWQQYHTPKNLAMALTVETAELLELFQWLTPEESQNLPPSKLADVQDELGDILIYVVRMCDELGIEPLVAAQKKLEKNKAKYPAEQVRGSAKKYNEY